MPIHIRQMGGIVNIEELCVNRNYTIKVIITGATSFIGIALIDLLQKEGFLITAIIRPNSNRKWLLHQLYPKIQIHECSLADLDKVELSTKKIDALFHIGWFSDFPNSRHNLNGQMQNVKYCLNAVKLAHKYQCNTFLSIGSQAECGITSVPLNSTTPEHPETAYAHAKCIAYEKTADLCQTYGIRQYWPRLLSAYGSFDRKSTLIMSCIHACKEKTYLKLTPAEQLWDYIYIQDVAEALLAVWKYGIPGKKYSIASGNGKKLKEYIAEIAEIMEYEQLLNGIGDKNYDTQQVMHLVGDIQELTDDTGFIPKWDFKKGVKETIKSLEI